MQKKTILYTIANFFELAASTKSVRNVISTSPDNYWETESEVAVLEIKFEPLSSFSIHFSILHIGIMSTVQLTIYIQDIMVLTKTLKKVKDRKSITIPSSKLKLPTPEINSLKFEFQKADRTIKICFISLQYSLAESASKSKNSEKNPAKNTKIAKIYMERALKYNHQKNKEFEHFTKTPTKQEKTEILNEDFLQQQSRLRTTLENNEEKKKKDTKEYQFVPGHTNSYRNLLSEFIIGCFISDEVAKHNVIELIEAAGGCYLEEVTDFCNLIICEEELFKVFHESQETTPTVPISWLVKTINQREIQPFH